MSKFWDTLYSVKDRLGQVPGVQVAVRKRAILLEGDPLPMVIVSPGTDSVDTEAFNRVILYRYQVNVTLVQAGNRVFEQDVKDWLQLRQTVRDISYRDSLAGDPVQLCGFDLVTNPAVEIVSGASSNYDVTGLQLTYLSQEERLA
jgi:hypothetical protein